MNSSRTCESLSVQSATMATDSTKWRNMWAVETGRPRGSRGRTQISLDLLVMRGAACGGRIGRPMLL